MICASDALDSLRLVAASRTMEAKIGEVVPS